MKKNLNTVNVLKELKISEIKRIDYQKLMIEEKNKFPLYINISL